MFKVIFNFLELKVLIVKLKLKFLIVLKVINNWILYFMFILVEVYV